MKVLEELWYGNIKTCERDAPQGSPLRKSITCVSDAEEKLAKTLSAEQRKLLENLIAAQLSLTADLERDAFTTGLRLGARMMMEILYPDDGQNL